MKKSTLLAAMFATLCGMLVLAAEPPAQQIKLKDGSTLYLHPDGTSRMVDVHGKRIEMRDGEEMQTADGETILMKNKKVWVEYGPSGKGGRVLKTD
jgi:hypothetical protein